MTQKPASFCLLNIAVCMWTLFRYWYGGVIVIISSTSLECFFLFFSLIKLNYFVAFVRFKLICSLIGIHTSVWPLSQIFIQWTQYGHAFVQIVLSHFFLFLRFLTKVSLHLETKKSTRKHTHTDKHLKYLMNDLSTVIFQLNFLARNLHSLNK